jgi:hypothetical protein
VITHLSSLIIAIFSGKIGDALGYHGLFRLELFIGLATFVVLLYVVPPKGILQRLKTKRL